MFMKKFIKVCYALCFTLVSVSNKRKPEGRFDDAAVTPTGQRWHLLNE